MKLWYTVQRLDDRKWKWRTRLYDERGLRLEVNHQDDVGKDMECRAFESQGAVLQEAQE